MTYNFIIFPNKKRFTWESPFSRCECTSLKDATLWAEIILLFNKSAEYVVFKGSEGKKEYTYKREVNNA